MCTTASTCHFVLFKLEAVISFSLNLSDRFAVFFLKELIGVTLFSILVLVLEISFVDKPKLIHK